MSLFDSGVRPIVDQHLLDEAAKERNYGAYWSASSAGYCQRKLIFERLGVPKSVPDDPRKQRVFSAGHIFHNWIQELTRQAGVSVAQEVELIDDELMIKGHFDDLILINEATDKDGNPLTFDEWYSKTKEHGGTTEEYNKMQSLILYDYKTVNSRSFMWAKKNDNAMSHFHRMQLGTYMYMIKQNPTNIIRFDDWPKDMLKNLSEARILKIEKENLMMMEQQLMWSPELESEVLSYWNSLNEHWNKKTLPQCSCAAQEGGFMAKEKYNPYFYNDEPCSMDWFSKCKEAGTIKAYQDKEDAVIL